MTQDQIKKIHQWYRWILAAVLTALAILIILSCLDIYMSGPRPYSADAITIRFRRILIPVIIGILGSAGGAALNLLLPLERQRRKGCTSPEDIMLRLRQKADILPVQKEIRFRRILKSATAICFIALMIYPLVYFLVPDHFSISALNKDIIRAVVITLTPSAVGLILCWVCRALVNKSFQREATVYKQALSAGHRVSAQKDSAQLQSHKKGLMILRTVILMVAIIFVVIGIFNGGAEDVLKKAIAICTECIGLG